VDHVSAAEVDHVSRVEPGSFGLAAQHGQLVTEHQDLQARGGIAAGQQKQ